MKLQNIIQNIEVSTENAIIPFMYFNNDITSLTDNKYRIGLNIDKAEFKLEKNNYSTEISRAQMIQLESFGIDNCSLIKSKLLEEYERDLNKRLYSTFKEISYLSNPNKEKTLLEKLLFNIFKYEKIQNLLNDDFKKYLILKSNLIGTINKTCKANFIIVSKDLYYHILENKDFLHKESNSEMSFMINYVGEIYDLDIFVNFDNNISNEIIFGCNTSNIMKDIGNIVYCKNKNISEYNLSSNPDLNKYGISILDKICVFENSKNFYSIDKISMVKRNFWTFIKNKIQTWYKQKK